MAHRGGRESVLPSLSTWATRSRLAPAQRRSCAQLAGNEAAVSWEGRGEGEQTAKSAAALEAWGRSGSV